MFLVLRECDTMPGVRGRARSVFPKPKVTVHQWVANSIKNKLKKKKGWVRIEDITVHIKGKCCFVELNICTCMCVYAVMI